MTAFVAAVLLAQAPKPLADLPFVHEPGRIWLKGTLNGRPAECALDTGASRVVAEADAALAAGAKKEEESVVYSLGGEATSNWRVSGLVFSLDGLDARHDVAYAASLKRADASASHRLQVLVGTDFLRRFVVEIDYPRRRVRFYAPEGYVAPEGLTPMAMRLVGGSPVVEPWLRLPGDEERKVLAMVDTGSTGITLTGSFAKREGLLKRFPDMARYDKAGGIGGRAEGLVLPGVTGDLAGEFYYGSALVDTMKVGDTGPDAPFDALLGDDVLARRVVVLDYGRSRMYLGKPSRGALLASSRRGP